MRKLLFILLLFSFGSLEAQNTWLKKADFGGGNRDVASGFAIGNNGYILSGTDTGGYFTDTWVWKSDSNVWRMVAPYAAGKRIGTRGVSLNGLGYVLGGEKPSNCFIHLHGAVCGGTFYKEIWSYNPDVNIWTLVDTLFPAQARDMAVAVASPADSTIYYGTGNANDSAYLTDWWAFYVPTKTWTQLADFPGGQRSSAVGFLLNGKIYVGTGNDNDSLNHATNDFWEYTRATNSWKRIADIPGLPLRCASAFAIGNYGYVCLGIGDTTYSRKCWRYNPSDNSWGLVASCATGAGDAVSFSIGPNGYVGTGSHGSVYFNQFWAYTPETNLTIPNPVTPLSLTLYPNPAKGSVNLNYSGVTTFPATISIMDVLGNVVSTTTLNINLSYLSIDVSTLNSGVYFYQITGAGKNLKTGKILISR